MTEEKTLGLKEEEKQPSPEPDQSEKKAPESPEELDKKIDQTLQDKDTEPEVEDFEDNKVVLSKEELEEIKKERSNYKKALLSLKPKLKAFKKPSPAPKKKKGEFLTRSEYQKRVEREAISRACKDSYVNDHWQGIMEFYNSKHGKKTVSDILTDIEEAKKRYVKINPQEKKDASAKLAAEKGKPKKSSKPSRKKKRERKILKEPSSIQSWYSSEKE